MEAVVIVLIWKRYFPTNHVFSHENCTTTIVFVVMTSVVVVDGVIFQQISYWC
jgi:hypothetical protein